MTSKAMATQESEDAGGAAAPVVPIGSPAILAAFTDLVTTIPEAPEDDGMGMILRILNVETWDELQESGKLPSSLDLAGRDVTVTGVFRKPSDNPTATGFYLLCDAVDKRTGEAWKFTAGGAQTVATLAKLHQLGAFPAVVHFETVATRSGQTAVNALVKAASSPAGK